MKKNLLFLATLLVSIIGYSQTFTYNYVTYTVTSTIDNTVSAIDYDISGGTVVNIPYYVVNSSTAYAVTNIGNLAFFQDQLTSVTLPNSVTSINLGAFQDNSLTSISIPNSVTSIGNNAFFDNQITSVVIPSSVTSIGNRAFQGNPLTSLDLQNGVSTLGDFAFLNHQLTSLTIPNSVTNIGAGAFQSSTLASITSMSAIPATITTINGANDSFAGDRSGIALTIPSGTTTAYVSAQWTGFSSVTEAASLVIGDTFVIDYITYEVSSVTPNTVRVIDYDTAGGTDVIIPASVMPTSDSFDVTRVHHQAFQANGLTSVIIPNSVTQIGNYAFFQNSLTSVILPNGLTSIELGIFENNALTSITIPNGVTSISIGSFKNNALTSVTIPSSVSSIHNQAFRGNPLTSVTSERLTPPLIATGGSNDSFSSDRSTIHLYIPSGTMGAYVTDAGALWTGFNPVTEYVLSIDDYELAKDVKIVTTTDAIKVITANNENLQNYTLYSISGAKITTGTESKITTSSFAKGIYILKLNFNRGTVVKKVLLQ